MTSIDKKTTAISSNQHLTMHKTVEKKEDGRTLIYYSFRTDSGQSDADPVITSGSTTASLAVAHGDSKTTGKSEDKCP